MSHPLLSIPKSFHTGSPKGITSVCSAHPVVIEAALRLARELGRPALIEATCNQVNQDGGYTGMTPQHFRDFVARIARDADCSNVEVILGGDHLGPNPWKGLPAEDAMAKAETMIAAFAAAGFTKLHLDCSMGCKGEPVALSDAETARRAACLAKVAEAHAKGDPAPVYIIGTEVPVPGGATEALDRDHLQITKPDAVRKTHEVHRQAFADLDLEGAFDRVIGLVVQPGVEFGHTDVIHFDPGKADELTDVLSEFPGLVFEAHSTDYQTAENLAALVKNGFSILKVGPWLTFALREALYGLDAVADILDRQPPQGRLMAAMEDVMSANPGNWRNYYHGDDQALWLQRHFSLSDRIRYYWPEAAAKDAVAMLEARLEGRAISGPVARQYLPHVSAEDAEVDFDGALIGAVQHVLRKYENAIGG